MFTQTVSNFSKNEIPIKKSGIAMWHCVLIDDDFFIREAWTDILNSAGLNILTCCSFDELKESLVELPQDTPIFLDSDISPFERGEDVAQELAGLGYCELYLSTGYDAEFFDSLTCIKGVLGKEPPEWLLTDAAL